MTEIRDGVKTSRALCAEHAPKDMKGPAADAVRWAEKMQNATPQEVVAMLRGWLADAERMFPDEGMREMQVEQLKKMIEMMEGEQRAGEAPRT